MPGYCANTAGAKLAPGAIRYTIQHPWPGDALHFGLVLVFVVFVTKFDIFGVGYEKASKFHAQRVALAHQTSGIGAAHRI